MASCELCGRSPAEPYRRVLGNSIVEGCIGAIHGPYVNGPSLAWHMRPFAVATRRAFYEPPPLSVADTINGYPVVRARRFPKIGITSGGRVVLVAKGGGSGWVTAVQYDGDQGWTHGHYFDDDQLDFAVNDFHQRCDVNQA